MKSSEQVSKDVLVGYRLDAFLTGMLLALTGKTELPEVRKLGPTNTHAEWEEKREHNEENKKIRERLAKVAVHALFGERQLELNGHVARIHYIADLMAAVTDFASPLSKLKVEMNHYAGDNTDVVEFDDERLSVLKCDPEYREELTRANMYGIF
jgi:hypothetical protein